MNEDRFILRLCTVESVEDNTGGLRIKVRIPYFDPTAEEDPNMERIPYCFPLLPKMVHINPKIGEMVIVLLLEQGSVQGDRFFIGPVISQDYYMENCKAAVNAGSLLQGVKVFPPQENPSLNDDNTGTIPERTDIALRGRSNSDLVLKNNELRLRCGFKKNPNSISPTNNLNFNKSDLSYLQEKYYPEAIRDSHGEFNSVVNVVADRINLLSHDGSPYFNMGDKEKLITDEEQNNIEANAHPMVYGDTLIMFLRKLVDIFINHEHPYPMMPPAFNASEMETLGTDFTKFISKTIKIN